MATPRGAASTRLKLEGVDERTAFLDAARQLASDFESSPAAQLVATRGERKRAEKAAKAAQRAARQDAAKGKAPSLVPKAVNVAVQLVGMLRPVGLGNLQGYCSYAMGPHSCSLATRTTGTRTAAGWTATDIPLFRLQPKFTVDVDSVSAPGKLRRPQRPRSSCYSLSNSSPSMSTVLLFLLALFGECQQASELLVVDLVQVLEMRLEVIVVILEAPRSSSSTEFAWAKCRSTSAWNAPTTTKSSSAAISPSFALACSAAPNATALSGSTAFIRHARQLAQAFLDAGHLRRGADQY